MKYEAIKIKDKYQFEEQWQAYVIAQMNDYEFKIARVEGEFIWHDHKDTDEVFIIIEGELDIEFRDGKVSLEEGDMYVIPKGVEHKPLAKKECKIMLVEPKGVVNTGDEESEFTVKPRSYV